MESNSGGILAFLWKILNKMFKWYFCVSVVFFFQNDYCKTEKRPQFRIRPNAYFSVTTFVHLKLLIYKLPERCLKIPKNKLVIKLKFHVNSMRDESQLVRVPQNWKRKIESLKWSVQCTQEQHFSTLLRNHNYLF